MSCRFCRYGSAAYGGGSWGCWLCRSAMPQGLIVQSMVIMVVYCYVCCVLVCDDGDGVASERRVEMCMICRYHIVWRMLDCTALRHFATLLRHFTQVSPFPAQRVHPQIAISKFKDDHRKQNAHSPAVPPLICIWISNPFRNKLPATLPLH